MGILLSVLFFAQAQPSSSVSATSPLLRAAVEAYSGAIVGGRRDTLENLLHDNFVITAGDGQRRNKTRELADLVGDGIKVHEFSLDEATFIAEGTTGVATGILRWKMTYQGRDAAVERRTTMTWVYERGAWRLLAQHVSRLK